MSYRHCFVGAHVIWKLLGTCSTLAYSAVGLLNHMTPPKQCLTSTFIGQCQDIGEDHSAFKCIKNCMETQNVDSLKQGDLLRIIRGFNLQCYGTHLILNMY